MQEHVSVDEYISSFPSDIQRVLQEIRRTIRSAAPEAEEVISYQMPAFKLNGVLVYYAAFNDHVSLFPTGSGIKAFKDELASYKTSKGTVQFPLDKPLPLDLIKRIVEFRVKEDREKATPKGHRRAKGA